MSLPSSSVSPRSTRALVSTAILLLAVVVAFWAAKGAPDPPAESPEDTAVRERMANWAVRDAKQWTAEHGDVRLNWHDARGHVAIVIDDIGRELALYDKLAGLRYPLAFSVLPGSAYAAGVQLRLLQDRRRPREILLHLPMEPLAADEMTAGAEAREEFLLSSDSPATLRDKIARALARVPAAVGVNNHMGSRLTADSDAMRTVMDVLRERDLFFLDSRTSADTVAESLARESKVPALHRHIFLDHDPERDAIDKALDSAAALSLREPAVLIGHPSRALVDALTQWLPTLRDRGIGVYPLTDVLRHSGPSREDRSSETTPTHIIGGGHP